MTNKSARSISNFQAALFALSLDREATTPLHVQLAEALRDTRAAVVTCATVASW